jgi:hypothetical protein
MGLVNYMYWQEGERLWLGYIASDPSIWALGWTPEYLASGLRLIYRLEMDAHFDSDAGKALAESYENLLEALKEAGVDFGPYSPSDYAKNNHRELHQGTFSE